MKKRAFLSFSCVMPAKAGIQGAKKIMLVFAALDLRLRGDDLLFVDGGGA